MFGFYSSARIRSGKAHVGNFPVWLPRHLMWYRDPIPLEELLRLKSHDLMMTDGQQWVVYNWECQALVHYLIFHRNKQPQKRLAQMVKALNEGLQSEEALERVVGDLKGFERSFHRYIRSYDSTRLELPSPPQAGVELIPLRRLSPGEVAAVRGDFLIYEGELDGAQAALEEALRLEPDLAAVHETIALLLLRRKQPEQALDWLDKALASDPTSSRGHYLRAKALADRKEPATSPAEVVAAFRKAIDLDPRLAAAHHGIAEFHLYSNTLGKNILATAHRAVAIDPANAKYQVTLARLFLRLERPDLAESAAQLAMVMSRSAEERSAARAVGEDVRRILGSQMPANSSGQGTGSQDKQVLKRGKGTERAMVQGQVVEVRCEGFKLELELEASQGRLRLHSENYARVGVSTEKSGALGDFRVCRDLRDVKVSVRYNPVDEKTYAGEIESIRVWK